MALETDNIILESTVAIEAEASYGDDPTIDLSADAFLVDRAYDFQAPRDIVVPEYAKETGGALHAIAGLGHAEIKLDWFLGGAGATDNDADAIRDEDLLNAAHWVVSDATANRTIKPRTAPNASVWIELMEYSSSTANAGNLIQLAGCRGQVDLLLEAGQPGKWIGQFQGLYGVPTEDTGWGAPTYDQEKPPCWIDTTISIGGETYAIESFRLNNPVDTEPRLDGGSTYGVAEIVTQRRHMTGEFTCFAEHNDRDWVAMNAAAGLTWSITGIGSAGGNRFGIAGTSNMIFTDIKRGTKGGRRTRTISYVLLDTETADGDVTITLYGANA